MFDLTNLSAKLSDWSAWDDTYKFIEDRNRAFIDSNLVYSSIVNLKIDFMIFVNASGEIVQKVGIDKRTPGTLNGIPEDLEKLVLTDKSLTTHPDEGSEKTGLLMINEGPLMFASRPIVTSTGRGPIKGSLIFGKYLNEEVVRNLSEILHLSVSVVRADRALGDSDQEAYNQLSVGQTYYIKPQSASTGIGYALLKDYAGKPAVMMKVDYPKDITIQGYRSLTYFIYSYIAAGLVFIIVLAFFLGRFLIDRIESLSREITQIGESGSLRDRVMVEGPNDEIALLAGRVNRMLDRLTWTAQEVQKEKAQINTFFDIVSGIVVVVSRGGKILSINKKGGEILGLSEESAVGRNWIDFVPDNDKDWVRRIHEEMVEYGNVDKYGYLEHPIIDRDGKQEMFGWYNSSLKDAEGKVIATVSHGENVSKIGS